MFSHTKSSAPQKKKGNTEPVEKKVEATQTDLKQTPEEGRKTSVKGNARKPKQSDGGKSKAEGKGVAAPEPAEVPVEPEKDSSEDEVKLVDTIKPLKEELKLVDCVGFHCMDEYHSTLFVEKYFKSEFEAGKCK